jgi:hypothetical protein
MWGRPNNNNDNPAHCNMRGLDGVGSRKAKTNLCMIDRTTPVDHEFSDRPAIGNSSVNIALPLEISPIFAPLQVQNQDYEVV